MGKECKILKYSIWERMMSVWMDSLQEGKELKRRILEASGYARWETLEARLKAGLYDSKLWLNDDALFAISQIFGVLPKDLKNYDENSEDFKEMYHKIQTNSHKESEKPSIEANKKKVEINGNKPNSPIAA